MEHPKIRFVLEGFKETLGFRVFAFDGVTPKWEHFPFTVKIDLALARRYGIQLQELPLLCRAVLDSRQAGGDDRAFTYTEADMCAHANEAQARREAAKRGRSLRRVPPESPANST